MTFKAQELALWYDRDERDSDWNEILSSTKEKFVLSLIPRFSGLFIIAIGILIITGPTLLWFLDDNVSSLTESTYGKLIMLKIGLAISMTMKN